MRFYRDVVGLAPHPNAERRYTLLAGGVELLFHEHSEVKGTAAQPERMMFDLFVDDLRAEQARLEAGGVTFIRTAGKEFWGGVISTFVDPDGNYCQLIEAEE